MFQVERLNVVAKTLDQIAEEIEEGRIDNITELKKAVNTCIVNSTALKHFINLSTLLPNNTESEEQGNEDS